MAYQSNESGRDEVYVTAFPSGVGKRLVSANGGIAPRWSPEGKELFYVEGSRLMAVPVRTAPGFEAGSPRLLFTEDQVTPPLRLNIGRTYDVARGGRRFVVVQRVAAGEPGRPTITVVQDWAAAFQK